MSKNDNDDYFTQEGQNKYFNTNLLRNEHEFFKEEENIVYKSIRVRRIKFKKGEDWEIVEDKKVVLTLKGISFKNAEKDFFKTPEGMKFIIEGYKIGWNSASKFKKEVGKIIK